jgi:hypothetical protein
MKADPLLGDRRLAAGVLFLLGMLCVAPFANGQDADALRQRHVELGHRLADNPFRRPLTVDSTQTDDSLAGEIHAVIAQPFGVVSRAFQGTDHWCDILMLHINVKRCAMRGSGTESVLSVTLGGKDAVPPEGAYLMQFASRVTANEPEYLAALLEADAGPLGTRNHRILLEAVGIDATSSFVHVSYSHSFGTAARIALGIYLATIGRDRVGFSVVDRRPDGAPVHVRGVRGMIERNAMRHYLAIEAYLAAYLLPAAEQREARLQEWFSAIERHPRQLQEMTREEYLSMKRIELARQRPRSDVVN